MEPVLFIGFIVLVSLAYAAQSRWLSVEAKTRGALRRAQPVRIRDAVAGEPARVVGKVRLAGASLRAPLSGRQCVYYEVTVDQDDSGHSGGRGRIISEQRAVDFMLEDGTGRALVRTSALRAVATVDATYESGFLNDATPALEAFLAKHGQQGRGLVFNKNLRYRERVFRAGERVTALGVARWEQDPDPTHATTGSGYRDAPKRLSLSALPEGHVLASDDPALTSVEPPADRHR